MGSEIETKQCTVIVYNVEFCFISKMIKYDNFLGGHYCSGIHDEMAGGLVVHICFCGMRSYFVHEAIEALERKVNDPKQE
jgi:hypothetical protein